MLQHSATLQNFDDNFETTLMESEIFNKMKSIWNQGTKAERLHHRSVSDSCYDDPIPKYISPDLVMLIAQNAPSELDVFKTSLTNRSRMLTSTWLCDLAGQELSSETKNIVEATSKVDCGVQVIFPSEEAIGTKKTVKSPSTGGRSSSDIMIKSDDADGGGSEKVNKVRKKRSAPATPELCNADSRSTNRLIPRSSNSPKSRLNHQYAMHSSSKSVDLTSAIKRKPEESRPLSAPGPVFDAEMYQIDALKAKPWRHGMGKKQKSAESKSCEKISSKRKAELDEEKKSELKKYMAAKFGLLRKERRLQEARAAAAEVARKEKQRKLDAECQALLKSQAANVKSKRKVVSRPPWISTEYVTLAESCRPWSSVSTGDLPPPKVPQNQEPVPLDLYTSITCEAVQESAISNKRRFKKTKLITTEAEIQLKESADVKEMAFCPTHPYHALHPSPDPQTPKKKTPVLTKARWKSKGRSLKTFNTFYQLRLSAKPVRKGAVDLTAYKKIAKISHTPQNGRFGRETRSTRLPKQSKSFSRKGYSNVLQQDDRYAVSVLKEHARKLTARSSIKLPKVAVTPTSLQKLDCNPMKNSRVESGKRRCEDVRLCKELSRHDMAKVMDTRLSHHFSRAKNHKTAALVSPSKVHSDKSGGCVSLSPSKPLRDEAALQVLKPERHSTDRKIQHVAARRRKDIACVESDADITKDTTLAIRRQRMHMLRSLAEQLLKRLDAACAEHLQNTPKTASKGIFESHVNTGDDLSNQQFQTVTNTEPGPKFELQLDTADKLSSEPVVLQCLDESLALEMKLPYHHLKKPDLLYQGNLSEKEQAGFETIKLPGEKVVLNKIPSVQDISSENQDPSTLGIRKQNEIYSHCILRDKDLCLSKIIPSGRSSSSSGSSCPSFDSNHMQELEKEKHGQKLEEETPKKRPKKVWTLPVEEDPYSVINLYTEHWFSMEKKSRVRSELEAIGQCEGEENISSASKLFTPSHERAHKKHKFKSGAARNSSELEVSGIRSAEISCTRRKNGVRSSEAQGEVAHYLRESAVRTSSTSSHLGETIDTTPMGPMKEDNSGKHLSPGGIVQKQLEGMLVQMDNLLLLQSPRSFNQSLEKHSRQVHQEKSATSLDEATASQMENVTADPHPPLTESSQQGCNQQTSDVYPSPLTQRHKVTIRADKNIADDQKMAILRQVHQEDNGPVGLCVSRNDSSESSNSEVSLKNLRGQIIDVEGMDIPDYHSNGKTGNNQFEDNEAHNMRRSKGNASPSDRSSKLHTINVISDERIILKKDSIGSSWRTRKSAAVDETQHRCDHEEREDQHAPQKACKDLTTISNHSRPSTVGSNNRSCDTESSFHSTGTSKKLHEKQLEFSLSLECEFQPELQQVNDDVTQEWQLQSKRCLLEAELQKLDAEIKRTRAKLEANQSGTKIRTHLRKQVDSEVDMLVPVSKENKNNSEERGAPSHNLDNCTLPHSLHSALSNSPLLKNIAAVSPKAAGSFPLGTTDRKEASPVDSNSFVSEDIQIEENASDSNVATHPHPQEKVSRSHHRTEPDLSFMNENLEHSEEKNESISSHDHSTSKVVQEELTYHRTASTRDVHTEGTENSTGRVLHKKWSRPSKEMQEESVLPVSDSPKAQTNSPRLQSHQAVYSPFSAMGVGTLRNKESMCTLFTKAPEANLALKADEDLDCTIKLEEDGNSSFCLPASLSAPNSKDSRDDDNGDENSCNHWKDGQNGSIYTGQQFWSTPIERKKRVVFTPISGFNSMQSTTSLPEQNLCEVEMLEEVPASISEPEVRPELVNQVTPEVEKLVERSDLSSSVEMELNMTSEGTDYSASTLNPSSRYDAELQMTTKTVKEDSASSSSGADEQNKSIGSCEDVSGLIIPPKPEASNLAAEVSDISEISSVLSHDSRTRSAYQFQLDLTTMGTHSSDSKEDDLQGVQDISPNVTRTSPENLTSTQNQNHTLMVLEAPNTSTRCVDGNGPMLSNGSESESEKSISDEDVSQISTPNQAHIINLETDMDTTADLSDTAPREYSDSCSDKEHSEALVCLKTVVFSISSSKNLVANDDRPGKTSEAVQELSGMVANTETQGRDEQDVPVAEEDHHSNCEEPINSSSEDVYISKSHSSYLESEDNGDDDFGSTSSLRLGISSPWKEVFQSDFDQLNILCFSILRNETRRLLWELIT